MNCALIVFYSCVTCDLHDLDLSQSIRHLVLLTKRLDVCFAVLIEEFFAPFLPCRFKFGRCDVPVRPAFPDNDTQVLSEILDCGSAKVPVAVVDPINDKTGL